MKLSQLQQTIINAKENKIAVIASAAAGKTATLTEKTRQLLLSGVNPFNIAVITFTRMAAQELIQRLDNDYKEGIFIGTIHSLAAHFLAKNGMGSYIGQIAEEENFDKLFSLCKDLNIKKTFDWILLDEAQDCGEKELNFIFDLIQPNNYFICLDFKQSIYGFRGARPDILEKYLIKNNTVFYNLNENYRNGIEILNYAKAILKPTGMEDDSIPMRLISGKVISKRYSAEELANMIIQSNNYKQWAILCRTNIGVDKIINDLNKYNIPSLTFKQGDLNKKQLENLMNSNTVKVLTVHSSKGLAWDNVVTYKLWWSLDERRINYVAATRARNLLVVYK